ncbi:unnamed protein product [Closterium sp. NIES-53]
MVSASTTWLPQSAPAPTTTATDGGLGGATRLHGGGGGGGGGTESGGFSGGGGGGGGSGGGGGGSSSGGGGGGGGGAGRGTSAQRGGSGGSQRQQQPRPRETPSVQQLREWYAGRGRSGGAGPCTNVLRSGTGTGEFPDAVEVPHWHDLLLQNVPIFDLDFDAILAAMYAIADSAEGDCYLRVPPDPGIEAAALGASASAAPGAGASAAPGAGAFALSGTAPTESLHTFTLDSGASRSFFRDSTTLTPLSQPVAVSLADPSGGPVLAHSSTVLPCPAAPSGLLSGLHVPSFSTNLASGADLRDAWVAASSQVFAVTSLPPLPPGPAPTCVPSVEGRQHAAPHSSSFPPTEAPLQTLHMDVWGPARVRGQGHERYFLLVVDDYSRYTTVFPLRSKDRGGEFSSDLLRAFCRLEGIRQTFTLPASPQQNGIAEHRIGMVMDVARMSMIHAAAPHFLWPFAVQYAAHQINLQPSVSLPETTLTLRWTGKVGDASAFRFYHPTSRRILSSQDVTFDESVSYYHPAEPVEVAVDSGAESGGAEPAGAGTGGAESGGAESGRVEPGGAEPGRVEPEGTVSGGAEPARAASGGALGVPPWREPLSPQQLCEWYSPRCGGAAGASGGAAGAGAAGGAAGARGTAGAFGGAAGAGGATRASRGAAGANAAGGAAGARAAGGAASAGAAGGAGGAAGAGAAGGAAGAGAAGGAARTGDPGAGGSFSVSAVSGGAARLRPYYVPLLQQVLGSPPSPGPPPPSLSPPPVQSQSRFQPASPLPGPSPYSGPTRGLTERRERESRLVSPESRSASPVRPVHAGRVSRPRPPPVPGTHSMTLRPSTAPQRVPLPSPPASSLPASPDPVSDSLRAASPADTRFLATTSMSVSVCPLSVGGECALGTDVLEDRQEEFECFAASVPHLVSMLLAPEGDPDAPDIPTPRSYAEAIEGPYSSQWQAAMDAEMASWKSTGTYVDEVPPRGANIVSGMWIFRGVDFFQTFSPTPKMTTLRVLLHVAAQRDYELHSLDFSTAFLQGSLHEEIWLRHPLGFNGSFPSGTQCSLRRPVYGLRQAPREWHDTLRTTLAALGFAPSTSDPSLFLRTDTTLPPFYVLVYVDDLVFATADTEALAHVLQRFGFTYSSPQSTPPLPTGHSLSAPPSDESVEPSGPYPELVGCLITSGMGLVLGGRARVVLTGHSDASWVDNLATQRSSQGYTFSLGSGSVSWRSTRSSSVLSSSCAAEIYAGAMGAQELRWLTYLLTDLGEAPRSPPVLYVDNKAMLALC